MTDPTPNLPLLRKAVAWAELEALKPEDDPDREWNQSVWIYPAADRAGAYSQPVDCKTAYCIAGYVCHLDRSVDEECDFPRVAEQLLGLTCDEAYDLFHWSNEIESVRDVAERIAVRGGETL